MFVRLYNSITKVLLLPKSNTKYRASKTVTRGDEFYPKATVFTTHPQAIRSIAGGVGERVPPQKRKNPTQ